MNIEPVKKTSKVSKSSDKRQKKQGKQKNPQKFLEKFKRKLDTYRKRKITKNNLNTRQEKYKSKSLQEIYRKEAAKSRSCSKVYHKLNNVNKTRKQPTSREVLQIQEKKPKTANKTVSREVCKTVTTQSTSNKGKLYTSRYISNEPRRSNSRTAYVTTRNNYRSKSTPNTSRNAYSNRSAQTTTRDNYRGRSTSNSSRRKFSSRSVHTTTRNNYSNRSTQTVRTRSNHRDINALNPNSKVNTQKAQSTGIRKQTQNDKNQPTAKPRVSTSANAKTTTTSKTRYTSRTSKNPQQLMRSVQKRATRRIVQHPTNSIEKMLGEYNQAYRKPKDLNRTDTRQNRENIHKATQAKKQILTKKEEVQQFKKGIANTKQTTKDIAYREYEGSQYKRNIIQRRMNNNRER